MQTELDCVYLSATVATSSVSSTSSGTAPPPAGWVNRSRVTGLVLRLWVMVKPKTSRVSTSAGS